MRRQASRSAKPRANVEDPMAYLDRRPLQQLRRRATPSSMEVIERTKVLSRYTALRVKSCCTHRIKNAVLNAAR